MKSIAISLIMLWIAVINTVAAEDQSMPDGTIYGHVYDAQTKQPLSNAWVYCQEVKCPKQLTDSNGYYAIENCFSPSSTYVIDCTKNGYPTAKKTVETDSSGKAEIDFILSNAPNPSPNTEADDAYAKTKEPATTSYINFTKEAEFQYMPASQNGSSETKWVPCDTESNDSNDWVKLTDRNGTTYWVKRLCVQNYNVSSIGTAITSAGSTNANGIRLFGYIHDVESDMPINGARVVATDQAGNSLTAVTDMNGYFTLNLLKNVQYTGNVGADGYLNLPIEIMLSSAEFPEKVLGPETMKLTPRD